MEYLYLSIAIAAEVLGTSALNASQGFTRLCPGIIAIMAYGTSLYLLSIALKTIPVGVAYAIWSGVGMSLVVIVGAILFRQVPDVPAVVGIVMIMTGVLVINMFSKSVGH